MPFIPESVMTVVYAVALSWAVAVAWRNMGWRAAIVSAVMVGNWLLTRLVTAMDWPGVVMGAIDLASAALLIASLWLPSHRRTMAELPVAGLFALMVGCYLAFDAGVIGRETMWAWVDVAAYCQLLLVAGYGLGHGRRTRRGLGTAGGDRDGDLAGAVARRVPDR